MPVSPNRRIRAVPRRSMNSAPLHIANGASSCSSDGYQDGLVRDVRRLHPVDGL